mmetsp:Transcript_113420/g.242058  ORF Transcript_113420/g.242058 Transcript_113420/m.242058 type:complete len:216 (-) Transcript_113420:253-900(-)
MYIQPCGHARVTSWLHTRASTWRRLVNVLWAWPVASGHLLPTKIQNLLEELALGLAYGWIRRHHLDHLVEMSFRAAVLPSIRYAFLDHHRDGALTGQLRQVHLRSEGASGLHYFANAQPGAWREQELLLVLESRKLLDCGSGLRGDAKQGAPSTRPTSKVSGDGEIWSAAGDSPPSHSGAFRVLLRKVALGTAVERERGHCPQFPLLVRELIEAG